jgi:MATE family multidrug resistance protein
MRGSALGTVCGTSTIFACYLLLLPRRFFAQGCAYWRQAGWPRLRAQVVFRLRRGAASGAAAGVDELGNTAFVWLAAVLGPFALAANNLDLTLNYLAIVPVIGLGIGCSVLCGNAIGRDDFAGLPRILRTTLLVEGLYVLAVSLLQIAWPDGLLRPFGANAADPRTHAAAVATARVLWTYSASFMFSVTGAAVLESFGMTRFVLCTRLGVMWGLSLPLISLAVARAGEEPSRLPWIWVVGSIFEAIIGAAYFLRIRQATDRRMNLLNFQQAT